MNPFYLPKDVDGLRNDIYRALAWMIRCEGGYGKSDKDSSEFLWANFFRENLPLNQTWVQSPFDWCAVDPYDAYCLPNQSQVLKKGTTEFDSNQSYSLCN